eukprot:439408-Prorocentrum_minimum.AAC.5
MCQGLKTDRDLIGFDWVTVAISVNDQRSMNYPVFSYRTPEILSTNVLNTTGGGLTITGRNFGVIGSSSIGSVRVNNIVCASPTVTDPHTEIQCLLSPSVGALLDVVVTCLYGGLVNPKRIKVS